MRRILETSVIFFSWTVTIILCLTISIFIGYLLIKGIPAISINLFFGQADPLKSLLGKVRVFDGIFPAMAGTFCLIGLSTIFAVPMGLCSGIYLAEYAGPVIKKTLGIAFDILGGIPSIVIGLFGFSLAIILHHRFSKQIGPSLLISALSLSVLVLPYIVRSTQSSLESLSPDIRITAMTLGASKLQNILYVLLPNALSGITSGVILAIGRCAEDTAVILLTGVVASAGIPSSLLSQYEALPFYIFYISNEYSNPAELSKGFAACLTLLAVCSILFMTAYGIKQRWSYRALYRA